MILKEIQTLFHKELDSLYTKEEVDSFFYILTDYYLGMPRLALSLHPGFAITMEEEQPLFEAMAKLKVEEPIQYIIGETEFYGLTFNVNSHTLIPRPETEELVNWITSDQTVSHKSLHILDIGTGSGCIAVSLAKNLPNAKVFAIDVSERALITARQNALMNDVDVKFIQRDILNQNIENLEFKNVKFDSIVSNPPYVRHQEKSEMKNNVLNYEPELALFVPDSNPLIFYKIVSEFATNHLTEGGQLYFEINQYLGNQVVQLLENFKFESIELKKDLFGNDRMVKAVWLSE